MQPQELEERLYHQLFGVMTAARDAVAAAPVYEAACTSLVSHLQLAPMTISRRFVAMRGFFVLGNSLVAEHPLRPVLFEALQNTDLLVPPPLATDDWLKLSLRNNHLLVQAAMLLVWPEAPQARACAEDLTARYLAEMTADGLFPAELCRGASCLWYSNMAAMLLTAIAKISARDGRVPIVKTQDLSRAIEGFGLALNWPPEVQQPGKAEPLPPPEPWVGPDCARSRILARLPSQPALSGLGSPRAKPVA